jgi:hypothetical protein
MYQIVPARVFLVAAISIGFGVWSYRQKRARLATWTRVTAVVDNVRRDRNGNVRATFKYADQKGERQTCILPVASGNSLGLGAEMQIAYNPAAPNQAFVCDGKDMNLTLIVSLVIGLVLIGVGVMAMNSGARLDHF